MKTLYTICLLAFRENGAGNFAPFLPNSAICAQRCPHSILSSVEMPTVSKQQKKNGITQMCSLKADNTIMQSAQNCWVILLSIRALTRTYHQEKACKRSHCISSETLGKKPVIRTAIYKSQRWLTSST